MLKYGLALATSLAIEFAGVLAVIQYLDAFLVADDVNAIVQLFVGPAAIIVMGFTVALFDGWRCRIVSDAYLERQYGFCSHR